MTENKKLITNIFVAILVFCVVTVGVFLVVRNGNQEFDPSKIDGLKPIMAGDIVLESEYTAAGKTLQVNIKILHNPGIWAGNLICSYDASMMKYISTANGDVCPECEPNSPKEGKVVLLLTNSGKEDIDSDGTLATLNFQINEYTKIGEYKITVDTEKSEFCNSRGALVIPDYTDATITVVNENELLNYRNEDTADWKTIIWIIVIVAVFLLFVGIIVTIIIMKKKKRI